MNLDAARTRSPARGSYEEYHPYGSTAWWAGSSALVSQKRYRFTGMERDEETGLQCHGVRYYAVWLGRWVSADPIGLGDGVNRYGYVSGHPIGGTDVSGRERNEPPGPSDVQYYAEHYGNAPAEAFLDKFLELRGKPSGKPDGTQLPLGYAQGRMADELISLAESMKTESYDDAVGALWNEARRANSEWVSAVGDPDLTTSLSSGDTPRGIVFLIDSQRLWSKGKYANAVWGARDRSSNGAAVDAARYERLAQADWSLNITDSEGNLYHVSFVEASSARRATIDAEVARLDTVALENAKAAYAEAEAEGRRAELHHLGVRVEEAQFRVDNASWKQTRGPETWKAFFHEFIGHAAATAFNMARKFAGEDQYADHAVTDRIEARVFGWPRMR